MNVQIFGKTKCFDTRKAERYFKERGIKYQLIDLASKGMSRGEFNSVCQALGGYESLLDSGAKEKELMTLVRYLAEEDREEKIFENQRIMRTPVVRNGRQATVGFCPDTWKAWC